MIPRTAIEKAIEGGWKYSSSYEFGDRRDFPLYATDGTKSPQVYIVEWHMAALDPSFWQALGKALGWSGRGYRFFGRNEPKWVQHAMAFYILILTNQPTEAFWSELLTSRTNK